MIQATSQTQIFLACRPADFRKGIDGLAREVKEVFAMDSMNGSLFIFSIDEKIHLK